LANEIDFLQKIIDSRKNKPSTNYINLECQKEQFDILIQKLHEITENKTFYRINDIEKLSIMEEIQKLVEQQKIIKSKITKLKTNEDDFLKNLVN